MNPENRKVPVASKLPDLARRAFRKIGRSIYAREVNLILEAPLKHSSIESRDHQVRPAWEDREFLPQVKIHFPRFYKLFRKRLEQNIPCFSLYLNNSQLIGYAWFAAEDYFEPYYNYLFILKPKQIYQFDGYIKTEHRSNIQSSLLLSRGWNFFLDKGFTNAIAAVDESKKDNLLLHSFLGFKETGTRIRTHYIFRKPFTSFEIYEYP